MELEAQREADEYAQAQKQKQETARAARAQTRQAPPPTRSNSVTRRMAAGMKEYFRPAQSRTSRKPSMESLRPRQSEDVPSRSDSAQGWRSWGIQRSTSISVKSNDKSARASGEQQRTDHPGSTKAGKSVDLNRPLPALPGLDQWKGDETEEAQTPPVPSHVAELMRPKTAPGNAEQPRSARSITSENRPTPVVHPERVDSRRSPLPANIVRHDSAQTNSHNASGVHTKTNSHSSNVTSPAPPGVTKGHLLTGVRPTLVEIPTKSPLPQTQSTASPQMSSTSPLPPRKESLPQHAAHSSQIEQPITNFSRKISVDEAAREARIQNEITALPHWQTPTTPSHERGLRKMLSSFALGGKKSRKHKDTLDYMQQPIALTSPGAAPAPGVRY